MSITSSSTSTGMVTNAFILYSFSSKSVPSGFIFDLKFLPLSFASFLRGRALGRNGFYGPFLPPALFRKMMPFLLMSFSQSYLMYGPLKILDITVFLKPKIGTNKKLTRNKVMEACLVVCYSLFVSGEQRS